MGAAALAFCPGVAPGAPPFPPPFPPPLPCAYNPVGVVSTTPIASPRTQQAAASAAAFRFAGPLKKLGNVGSKIPSLMCAPPSLLFRSIGLLFFCGQALVNGLDKRIRDSRLPAVPCLVRQRWMGTLDLIERFPLLDHRRNHVAHQHHHVAIVHHLHLFREASVTRNHISPYILVD